MIMGIIVMSHLVEVITQESFRSLNQKIMGSVQSSENKGKSGSSTSGSASSDSSPASTPPKVRF